MPRKEKSSIKIVYQHLKENVLRTSINDCVMIIILSKFKVFF